MDPSIPSRETLNAVWAFMSGILAWLFLHRVYLRMRKPGWYASTTAQLMLACGFYFLGSMISRGVTAVSLMFDNYSQYHYVIFGGGISLAATLCMVRIISKPYFGHWAWISALFASLFLGVGVLNHP